MAQKGLKGLVFFFFIENKVVSIVGYNSRHQDSSIQIDNIYVNAYKLDFSVYPFVNDLSDHDAQIIAFRDICIPTLRQSFTMIRRVEKSTIANFAYLLRYETWDYAFSETEVNVTYNNF